MSQVFVGFGSNLGDVFAHYHAVVRLLQNQSQVHAWRSSLLYLTEPHVRSAKKSVSSLSGVQQKYLNAVLSWQTDLSCQEVFRFLQDAEKNLGRKTGKGEWQPRTVDLDLLFYDDLIYKDAGLQLPHPHIAARRFVLKPFCDLAPDFVHPEFGLSMKKLLELCEDPLSVEPCQHD